MVYCCVPRCKSTAGKTSGVTFHEFPSSSIRDQWIKSIRRQGDKPGSIWTPTDRSKICSKHFLASDFSTSTKRKRILPNNVPTVFDDFPEYLKTSKTKRKSPKKCILKSGPSHKQLRTKRVQVDNESISENKKMKDAEIQVSVPKVTRKGRTFRQMQRLISKLKKRVEKLKKIIVDQRNRLKMKCPKKLPIENQFQIILSQHESKVSASASFIVEQVQIYNKKKPRYEEETLTLCVLLHKKSPTAYRFLRQLCILHIPHPATLKRFIGNVTTEVGVTSLIKARLSAEFKSLKNDYENLGSIIIDEMSIKPKLLYDRQLDIFVGQPTVDMEAVGLQDLLADKLLCFLFKGLSTSYRIVVGCFFVSGLTAVILKKLTIEVISGVESQGFIVQRIVTDNLSVNTCMFNLLSPGNSEPAIQHPLDPERIIFLSFDQCHVLKNVRSQFLSKVFRKNDHDISPVHLQRLYQYQRSMKGLVKPVRFLTRKHLSPDNFEKMHVGRAIQIFSIEITAALETMLEVSPEKVEDKEGLKETVHFMQMIRKWFDIHDICNLTHGLRSRNTNKYPFQSLDDERLQWLKGEFLNYITDIQASGLTKNKMLSDETFHALCYTTKSTIQCIQYLLNNGLHFVLSRKFSSDDIEGLFSHIRQLGGSNDMADARSCLFALESTIKTGIIMASTNSNVGTRCEDAISSASLGTCISKTKTFLQEPKTNQLVLPDNVMSILNFNDLSAPQATLQTTSIAMIGGYLLKVAEETVDCTFCLEKLVSPRHKGPLVLLIHFQDRGALKYPSNDFVAILDVITRFVSASLPYIHLQYPGVRKQLCNVIQPHLELKFNCETCKTKNLFHVLIYKFLNPLLDNFARHATDRLQKSKNIRIKPLSRKFLKLS